RGGAAAATAVGTAGSASSRGGGHVTHARATSLRNHVTLPLSQRVLDLACEIQQIPAPTFAEGERAAFVRQRFAAEGLSDVTQDELGNVIARLPGRSSDSPPVLVTAHMDTVFPAGTPLTL